MSDARRGFLATFIPFAALAAFWQLVVHNHNWAHQPPDGLVSFLKKATSIVLPIFLVFWAIVGTALTYKYTSERRELRELASKNRDHFEALPAATPLSPVTVPKDTARDAAKEIRFSRLKETIRTVKNKLYDSKEYDAFWKALQTAYGIAGLIRPTNIPAS
jgi:hypothetical protein